MTGRKTHEQHLRIVEKREVTSNADGSFDAEGELKRSKETRRAHRGGADLRGDVELVDKDDRQMIRGENQESGHHKRKPDS